MTIDKPNPGQQDPEHSNLDIARYTPPSLGSLSADHSQFDPEHQQQIIDALNQQRKEHEIFLAKDAEGRFRDSYGYPETSKSREEIIILIENFNPDPKIIYHPGCGSDLSLDKLYPQARVIHVDLDLTETNWHQTMIDAGYEAYQTDMAEFIPDTPADLTLIMNAGYIENDHLKKVVTADGIVIVNNWHSAASYMLESCPDFELVGCVFCSDPKTLVTNTTKEQVDSTDGAFGNSFFAFRRK